METKAGRSSWSWPSVRPSVRWPSSVFGGKNSNEKTGRCSSRMRSIRIRERLAGGNYLQARGDSLAPAQPVLDVHRVVLAVAAEEAEEDGRPAAHAELLLLERVEEMELVASDFEVLALALGHAVHEHPVRRPCSPGQRHAPARLGP